VFGACLLLAGHQDFVALTGQGVLQLLALLLWVSGMMTHQAVIHLTC
jgi:hypothetical protein